MTFPYFSLIDVNPSLTLSVRRRSPSARSAPGSSAMLRFIRPSLISPVILSFKSFATLCEKLSARADAAAQITFSPRGPELSWPENAKLFKTPFRP